MKTVIIKSNKGATLFTHACGDNTIKLTVEKAVSEGANLRGADLEGADLAGTNLAGAGLRGAGLKDANLGGAGLRGANLTGADLEGADLEGADLEGADLEGANLRDADLKDADLTDADLTDADLTGADLTGADITGARLWDTTGDQTYIKNIKTPTYKVCYTSDRIQIGCKNYSFEEWLSFSDQEIEAMDSDALNFWKEDKEFIFDGIEDNPARPTK